MSNVIFLGTEIKSSIIFRESPDYFYFADLPQCCAVTGMAIRRTGGLGQDISLPPEFAYCLDAPDVLSGGSMKSNDNYNVFD